ncbi:MAG: hypothetical protein RRY29_01505 [Desulfovibrionaceae bacterium]
MNILQYYTRGIRTLWGGLTLACLSMMLLCTSPAQAETMAGMGGETQSKKEGNVPANIETIIDAFLNAIPAGQPVPSATDIQTLMDYSLSVSAPQKTIPEPRPQGKGAFVRQTLQLPLTQVLQYCFNPAIPGEAVYPSTINFSYWLPQSQIVTQKIKLWEKLDLPDDSKPIVLRGQEFEEITPDTFSNCYYDYTLNRLLILSTIKGRNVLISVSRQAGPSSVGKVGAILGKDDEWHYLYSKEVGSNLSLARWAETYMYDSANLTIFFEPTPHSPTTEMAFFKYVRAGWSKMNMVKSKHIYEGSQRYLNGLRQILESPTRPSAENIAAKYREFKNMHSEQLRAQLVPFSTALAPWGEGKSDISSKDFKKLLGSGQYVPTLSTRQMSSELLKQFLKHTLQKPLFAPSQP